MIEGFVSSQLFDFLFSTQILIWVAVGGRATMLGPILGAVGLSFVTAELSSSSPTQWALFLGLLFVAVVVFIPDGVLPPIVRLLAGVLFHQHGAARAAGSSWTRNGRAPDAPAARRAGRDGVGRRVRLRGAARSCAASTSRSSRASSSASSGRTAPASRRC